jgi:hypothetical protein
VLLAAGVGLEFALAATRQVNYPDDAPMQASLEAVTYGEAGLEDVDAWRDADSADLVVLFRPYANDGRCGLAWVGGYGQDGDFTGYDAFGAAVVALNCSDYTLLHELGHNLGLVHSRREEPDGGALRYGAGFGVDDSFVTLLASPAVYNAPRLPRLASPAQTCNGSPCGIDHRDPRNGADAVRALNRVKDQIAAYRD